jgi:hypothetical protein
MSLPHKRNRCNYAAKHFVLLNLFGERWRKFNRRTREEEINSCCFSSVFLCILIFLVRQIKFHLVSGDCARWRSFSQLSPLGGGVREEKRAKAIFPMVSSELCNGNEYRVLKVPQLVPQGKNLRRAMWSTQDSRGETNAVTQSLDETTLTNGKAAKCEIKMVRSASLSLVKIDPLETQTESIDF